MDALLLLAAAVAPVALMLHFVYIRDKYDREPLRRVLIVFFIGCLSVIPAAIYESLFLVNPEWGLWGIAFTTFCVVALSEEVVKYWTLRFAAVTHPSFNEVYDGIIYAVAASLGFATVENILYVFFSGSEGWFVAVLRALLSVPGHALWGVMMGYYVGQARFTADPRRKRMLVWTGIGTAIFWHGLYDYFAFGIEVVTDQVALLFLLGLVGVVAANWVIGVVLIRRAQAQSYFKRPNPLLNPAAALNPAVRYCHSCGKPQPRGNRSCYACGYEFPKK
ncbi:MAG TPA: PrsW family intramembrane metalloprotease [Firmicutes bacterium]|nr:PrsW family intramembrane metalloprotease [Bacillota bacterium]